MGTDKTLLSRPPASKRICTVFAAEAMHTPFAPNGKKDGLPTTHG